MTNAVDNPLKIGVLSFAHMHAASYAHEIAARTDAELVAIWDADASRGERMASQFGAQFHSSVDSLLAVGLDGVIVTSENVYHRALVEASADAGVRTQGGCGTPNGIRAILCEKPLATNLEDGRAMIRHCAERRVALATAFPCRHAPAFQRLKQQVRSGAIGEVLAIRGTNRGRMPGGWFVERDLSGGGAVIDHTVHVADLNWDLLGRKAVDVHAEIGSGFHHQEWDDTGFLTIDYEGGIFATLDTSWSRPNTYPTWGDVTLQVVGTDGVLDLDLFGQHLTHYNDAAPSVSWDYWGSSIDGGLVDSFLRLCAGETDSEIATGEDGLRALAIALSAYRSAEIGQPVRVDGD